MGPEPERELELRRTLGKLEISLGAIREGLVWIGASGSIQWCNQAFDRLVGLPHFSILGRPARELLALRPAAGVPAADADPVQAAFRTGSACGDYVLPATGAVLEVEATRVELPADQRIVILVVRDVTQARRDEEASRRLGAIAESTEDAIWGTDLQGIVTDWNRSAERLYGYKAEEVRGRSISIILPPGREGELDGLFRRLSSGERVADHETERRRRDGTIVPVAVTLSMVRDAAGRQTGFSAVVRDLTAWRKAQRELQETHARLAQAYSELETFTYTASHDMRGPLRRIVNFSEILLRGREPGISEEAARAVAAISNNARFLAKLVDVLLELSRISRAPVARERFDLGALAEELFREIQSSESSKAEFSRPRGLMVEADRSLVAVLLRNLLSNAVKFSSGRPAPRVELGASQGEGRAYYVRDNGVGFDPALADRLFQPFTRLHRADEFPGTGVGLATVQRVAARHGGRVWASGRPGEGATFHFTLEAAEGAPV